MSLPTFLLLPGNMCDARLWRDIRLPDSANIIIVDLNDADTITGFAEHALEQASGRLILVGFSMGGIVAAEMCRIAPDRIAGLVLLDTNVGADAPERSPVRRAQQQAVRQGALAAVVADELKPAYLAAANAADDQIRRLLSDMALALGADVFIRQSEALRTRRDNRETVARLDVPILLLCGAEDRLCPPALHAELAASCQRARFSAIPGAGHMLPIEQPGAMNAEITQWIADYRGEICRA